jgi:hypothetical protein
MGNFAAFMSLRQINLGFKTDQFHFEKPLHDQPCSGFFCGRHLAVKSPISTHSMLKNQQLEDSVCERLTP